MMNFTCDRCGQPVERREVRWGNVRHLLDAAFGFDLCSNCFVLLRRFICPHAGEEDKTGIHARAQSELFKDT